MKAIDLGASSPTLDEVLELAARDNIVLKTADGREFVLAEIDDMDEEVALVRRNKELMELLDKRSQEKTKLPLADVRKQLKLK